MSGVQMELLSGASAGIVAQRLLANGFNTNALRTNGVLRKDDWIQIDDTVVNVARQRLVGVQSLMEKGLTYNLPNALGVTRLEWEQASDMDPAELSMSGVAPTQRDRMSFDLQGLPIPIIHKDFSINIRALESSRRNGMPLDTTQVALASRLVSEKAESLLFTGGYVAGTNGTVYGYTTAPNRNTGSVTASWATATGEQIVSDIIRMIGAAQGDAMFGPYELYVPVAVYARFGDDYKANSDRTILERILAIPEIGDVKPSANLTGTNVILVQMTSDVVDLIDGIQPMAVEWESQGGFVMNFKVLAILVPRIKSDQKGQSGVVHYS